MTVMKPGSHQPPDEDRVEIQEATVNLAAAKETNAEAANSGGLISDDIFALKEQRNVTLLVSSLALKRTQSIKCHVYSGIKTSVQSNPVLFCMGLYYVWLYTIMGSLSSDGITLLLFV